MTALCRFAAQDDVSMVSETRDEDLFGSTSGLMSLTASGRRRQLHGEAFSIGHCHNVRLKHALIREVQSKDSLYQSHFEPS